MSNALINEIAGKTNANHWSHIKYLAKSPQHYISNITDLIVPNAAMRIGTATDSWYYHGDVPLQWDGAARGRGKNTDGMPWATWADENGVISKDDILTAREYNVSASVVKALNASKSAESILNPATGVFQQKMFWTFQDFPIEGTPDTVGSIDGRKYVADLKVTAVMDKKRFYRHAWEMGWFGQVAWYMIGTGAVDGYLVAAQPGRPWEVVVYKMGDRLIEAASNQCHELMNKLNNCIVNDHWPWRYDDIEEIEIEDEQYELTVGGEEI